MHLDPRLPDPEACVTRHIIDRHARERPDKVYAVFEDDSALTYGDLRDEARSAAAGFQDLGVKQGDHVLVWLPNGRDMLRAWMGINYMGAVFVSVNTAYKGRLLEHVVENSDAELIVVHADLAPRLADIDRAALKRMVVIGGPPKPCADLDLFGADALSPARGDPGELERAIAPWDTQMIVYTSGTTGPSKGVVCSYAHLHAAAVAMPNTGPDDRFLATLPMFHLGGAGPCIRMMVCGGSIAIVDSFKTNRFWQMVRHYKATYAILLGVMAQFLAKQPEQPDDADNPLRTATIIPYDFDPAPFAKRFGVDTVTVFNMTETSLPIVSEINSRKLHAAGKPRAGVEARIVDENDCELPPGEIGELILRTDSPWAMNSGYYKNPQATAEAWRNGWFHTGDGFRRDEDGYFYFVDRIKDAIRRRGENISSYEVEAEVLAHPDVTECAAVAVKSEVSEDEVLVIVAPVAGKKLDPEELLRFLIPRMAHFMAPRYIRVVDALPRTPTEKVRKIELREIGVTPDTWDREAAGISVRRERIGS